jgi:hypothetical protein
MSNKEPLKYTLEKQEYLWVRRIADKRSLSKRKAKIDNSTLLPMNGPLTKKHNTK